MATNQEEIEVLQDELDIVQESIKNNLKFGVESTIGTTGATNGVKFVPLRELIPLRTDIENKLAVRGLFE